MLTTPLIVTFVLYFVVLLVIGWRFYDRSSKIDEYLLGGRGLGSWVTALSAQASDMSGWLLMGLPGAVFVAGLTESWIAVGLFIGTVLNWQFVAARLRIYTEKTDSITLPCFFEDRFRDPTGLMRFFSALVILFFFAIYASSGLVAAGKLFETMLGASYTWSVIGGSLIIIIYTFLGGFLAVCWTDLVQGILMFIAITVVPLWALIEVGGPGPVADAMREYGLHLTPMPEDGLAPLALLSTLAWGLGYFGQPHILARFMGIRSAREIPKSMSIAVTWVFVSLAGAVFAGAIGRAMFGDAPGGDPERVFIYMIGELFPPILAGVFLAAVLSAIMSTIDSQLLVCSSALAEDFYKKVLDKNAPDGRVVWVGRMAIIVVALVALVLALDPDNTVLGLVSYAWGGFGAAFGPVVLFALFDRRTSWRSALPGMLTGTLVLVLWKESELGGWLYEIVPGFLANAVTIFVLNFITPETDEKILHEFDAMTAETGGDSY